MKPKVIIILLNYNRHKDIIECLNSVFSQDYPNYEVVVVDNRSSDGSSAVIKREYPAVCLIENSANLGYAGGNNVGMRYAISQDAEYIWLLNDDTTVDPKCLNEIIEAAEKSDLIGLVSPIIYDSDNPKQAQFAGSYMNWKDISLIYENWEREVEKDCEIGGDLCLWGTALLIKRRVIEKIGYLKEEYFAYWEDIEYSLRSIRAGFKNIVCKSGKVFHKNRFDESGIARKGQTYHYFMQRNRIFLGKEYLGKSIHRLKFAIRYIAELSDYVHRCGKDNIDPCMNGAWHGIMGITGPMTSEDKMPNYIKRTLLLISEHHPIFFADLITLRLKKIARKISMRN